MDITFDWRGIAGAVAPLAPKLGSVLGAGFGPLGAIVGSLAGNALAEAFKTEPTPEAIGKAIIEDPNAAQKIQQLENTRGEEIRAQVEIEAKRIEAETEQFRIQADDTEHARQASAQARADGSRTAWAPAIITIVIFVGFIVMSALAMQPSLTTDKTIVFYLLSAWQSLATLGAGYWLGSSVGSTKNADRFANLAGVIAAKPNPSPAVVDAIKTASKRK